LKKYLIVILLSFWTASCTPDLVSEVTDSTPSPTAAIINAAESKPTTTLIPSQTPASTEVLSPVETSVPQEEPTPSNTPSGVPVTTPNVTIVPVTTPIVTIDTQADPMQFPDASGEQVTSRTIIVDHTSVELFEKIPDEYLEAAREIKMLFADRSVGKNIDDALNCLTAEAWHLSRAYCRNDYYDTTSTQWLNKTYTFEDFQSGLVPSAILFEPDPQKYDRSNWTFDIADGEWENTVRMFIEDLVPEYMERKDALSFQFTYFTIGQGSNIADAETGFFVDLPHQDYYPNRMRWDIGSLEELESRYPDKIFFYWTTSLARGIGSEEGETFNNQMREYVLANDKILFDVAAILSHDPQGNPCYDNRDGVEYCNNNRCENHTDDGNDYPAICQVYTTETDGGHLGSVSGGGIRVAKAFWVLMAMIAGWEG
jgi:hypothetical protein